MRWDFLMGFIFFIALFFVVIHGIDTIIIDATRRIIWDSLSILLLILSIFFFVKSFGEEANE